MEKELLKKLIREEYAEVYIEIEQGKLNSIPVKNGSKSKETFCVARTKNWGLSSGKSRKDGRRGDTTTPERLERLIDLGLITYQDFANYNGKVSLHKLIGYNNSDAMYIMCFLNNRIQQKHNDNHHMVYNDFGIEEKTIGIEGERKKVEVNRYERDRALRDKKIKDNNGDCSCSICGFNFEKAYGELGRGFIHVHHLIPLSQIGRSHNVDLDKLILVCPNCHAMLHRKKGLVEPETLKKKLNEQKMKSELL